MNKRLLVILGVFAGGFGVGYALTWFLVSNPVPAGTSPPTAAATAPGEEAIPTAAVPPAPGSEVRPSGTITAAGGVEAGIDDGADDAPPGGEAADAPPGDGAEKAAVVEAAGGAPGEVAPGEEPAADGPGGDELAPADPPATPPAPSGPWWQACKNHACAMDFGRVTGGVTVRKGQIEHGTDVVWRDTFADAERVGSLPAKDGIMVELRGVGLQHKLPVAAWITWHDGAREVTGVIALNIGDKVIKMVPPGP